MRSLDTFYQSKEWRKFAHAVKLSRVDASGQTICEHCGKPILRSYDCIAHHKIELTDGNINDASIALNPDLIVLVHHKCHNEIHDKLSGSIRRNAYIVYGAPLAGKSTYVQSVAKPGDLIVDIDRIWSCISGCRPYIKPKALNAVVFDLRDQLINDVKVRKGHWSNAYLIGGYPLESERERLRASLGAREIFIDTTKEECLRRLEAAGDGRNKADWRRFIEAWFSKYSPPPCAD